MVAEPSRWSTWTLRVVVYGGALAGVGLLVTAARSEDPPGWWWAAGIPLTAVCGTLAGIWIFFRLRYRSREQRQQAFELIEQRRDSTGLPLQRSRLAHRATKHKRAVLRSGTDATAVVTFLADGRRANEYRQLVYLELDVQLPDGRSPYQVRTGEYLNAASAGSVSPGRELRVKVDPADPQRVAVDWERSLRRG
jgi:hypothetical protein